MGVVQRVKCVGEGEVKGDWVWGRGKCFHSPFDDDEGNEAKQHSGYNGGIEWNEIITQAQSFSFGADRWHTLCGFW